MTYQIKNSAMTFRDLSALDMQPVAPLDLMGMVRTLWFGKYMIIACTLLAVLAAGYYAFGIAQPRYAATTTLEITTPARAVMDAGQNLAAPGADPVHINTQIAILRSKHLMVQVVGALDLTADPEFNRYLTPIPAFSVTGVRNRVRAVLTGQDDIVPNAAAILEKTAQNLHDAITAKALRDTYVFHITAETGSPAKSALIANTLAQIYLADQVAGRQAETETSVIWLSGKVAELQRKLEEQETAVTDLVTQARVLDPAMADALGRQAQETASRLASAQADLAIAQAAEQPAPPTSTITATPSDALAMAVDRHADQVTALTAFQASLNQQLAEHSAGLVRLQQLRREADATRMVYETFLRRLQETSIQRGMKRPDTRVLAMASPGTYVAPRKVLILAAAALLGGLAGIGIVVLRDTLRSGFTDSTALTRATGLPVLAHVSGKHEMPAAPTAVRSLRAALLLTDIKPAPRLVLFTAGVPDAGKTKVARGLVQHLVYLGNSVLLIAADPGAGPAKQSATGVSMVDLATVLKGQKPVEDAVFRDQGLGADVLAAGPSSADHFADPGFGALLANMRDRYDFVIIDAPPVLSVPETPLLAQHTDAVLFAVEWNRTPRHVVLAGCAALVHAKTPLTGLVMTQVDTRKMTAFGNRHMARFGKQACQN